MKLFVAIISTAFICSAAATFVTYKMPSVIGKDETQIISKYVEPEILCKFGDMSISSSGRQSAYFNLDYRDPPARQNQPGFLIADNLCLSAGGNIKQCSVFATGVKGLEFVAWGKDNTIIARSRNNLIDLRAVGQPLKIKQLNAVLIDSSTPQLISAQHLEENSNDLALKIRAIANISYLKGANSLDLRSAGILIGNGLPARSLVFDPSNLMLYTSKSGVDLYPLDMSLPYSGRLSFNRHIKMSRPQGPPFNISVSQMDMDDSVSNDLWSLQAPQSSSYYLLDKRIIGPIRSVIRENVFGSREYEINSLKGKFAQSCGSTPKPLNRQVLTLGTPARPLPMAKITGPQNVDGLAILFMGGPAGYPLRDSSFPAALQFIKLGYEVWLVGYSGSAGLPEKVGNRLRKDGLQSLVADAQELANYINGLGRKRTRVVIYGESFGAIPALSLSKKVRMADIILVAPLLKRREPESYVSRVKTSGFGVITAASQSAFERSTIGDVDNLDASNRLLFSLQDNEKNLNQFIAFAQNDPLSGPGDLVLHQTYKSYPTTHRNMSSNAEMWTDVQKFLRHDRVK